MPIYEYACADCGKNYEQIRRMTEADTDLECPGCRSAHVQRQLSSFATTSGNVSSSGNVNYGRMSDMGGCGKTSCCAITGGGCNN